MTMMGNRNDDEDHAGSNNNRRAKAAAEMAQPPPNAGTIEDSLSQELLKLSLTDRNAMEEEIHGVRCLALVEAEESSELLMKSLKEFDYEIMILKDKRKPKQQQKKKKTMNQNTTTPSSNASGHNGDYMDDDSNIDEDVDDEDVLRNILSISSSLNEATITTQMAIPESATDPDPSLCYVNDPRVRLRFLRTELFDAKKAAKRFVNYLLFTQQLFGNFVAERPIQAGDFHTREDIRALKESRVQFLPFRDRSGRRIIAGVQQANYDLTPQLRYKIFMYMAWIASEDIETQQKGVIRIAWPSDNTDSAVSSDTDQSQNTSTSSSVLAPEVDDPSSWERSIRPALTKRDIEYQQLNYAALPLRCVAIHFCAQDTPLYRLLGSLYYFAVSKSSKSRTKFHFGEPIENKYKLQSYGIPIELIPVTHTGTIKLCYHGKWVTYRQTLELEQQQQRQKLVVLQQHQELQQQQQQQQQQNMCNNNNYSSSSSSSPAPAPAPAGEVDTNSNDDKNDKKEGNGKKQKKKKKKSIVSSSIPIYDIVDCPRSNDIIFRKDKNYFNTPGNVYFRQLIEATNTEHSKLEKRTDKVAMTWQIYQQMEQERQGPGSVNTRFLDRDRKYNIWFIQKDRNIIREKIATTYREYNRSCRLKNEQKQQQQQQQTQMKTQQQYTQQQQQQLTTQRMIQLPSKNDHNNTVVVHPKRRKIMTTASTTNTNTNTNTVIPSTAMMSSDFNNKSWFGIHCGGGTCSGGGSEYESFESLFSDL